MLPDHISADVIFWNCSYSAATPNFGSAKDNLVKATVLKGAKCSIGYTKAVDAELAGIMASRILTYFTHMNLSDAVKKAVDFVRANYLQNSFDPEKINVCDSILIEGDAWINFNA